MCDGLRVAPVRVAALPWELSRGLLGQDQAEGALLLPSLHLVHTFGMRFPIDVAFCDRRLRVIGLAAVGRNRMTLPRVRSRAVVEAAAGAFVAWGLRRGSHLEIQAAAAN